jgi:serine phosphatase RsbU (regulator of sigma subunit)
MSYSRKNLLIYTAFGVAFGFCFPIIAILADIIWFKELVLSWKSIAKVHGLNPLHFIIDTAPLFLGIAFGFAGYKQDDLVHINQQLRYFFEEVTTQKEEAVAQNELLNFRNEEVERKSRDLNASIEYAKTIQNAILPDLKLMHKYLYNLFILHKARDVVSGDFYYFMRKDGKSILAVADCTGHGIPASFMSLIGYQHLNNIILQQHILEPHIILECLHEGIYSTLRQGETDNSDGMDIGLCVIDTNTEVLHFAGSQISLYYVAEQELIRIKGDRTHIGGKVYRIKPFEKHTIQLKSEEKTQFYLYSDGYQDQFGGAENSKFMSTRLKALLLKIYGSPAEVQKNILLETIENWINAGTKEQTDDILVLGFCV